MNKKGISLINLLIAIGAIIVVTAIIIVVVCMLNKPKIVKIAAKEGETHKGIVYLDPTNLNKKCTLADVKANINEYETPTEIKTGCMKWYIFDDSGKDYKLILDHNTTAGVKWNNKLKSVTYEKSKVKTVVDDLEKTSNWKVTPRLITGEEIAAITKNKKWKASDVGTKFYLDTNSDTESTFTETERSKYDWLFNNTWLCEMGNVDAGCTINDNMPYKEYGTKSEISVYGYWTSSQISDDGYNPFGWYVTFNGALDWGNVNNVGYGIRPVIELPESYFVDEQKKS